MGSSASLTAVFANGSATIDHGVGTAVSQVPISTGPIAEDTLFTLTVVGATGTTPATQKAMVHVAPAPITPAITAPTVVMEESTGLTASASPLVPGLQYLWTISGGVITSGANTAQITFSPTGPGTLQLSCSTRNDAQAASPSCGYCSIQVLPVPVIRAFQGNPSSVGQGQSSTLSWSVAGADHLSIQPGIGDVTGSTSCVTTPSASTTYTLTASNAAGSVSAAATVYVSGQKPTITAFTTSPTTLTAGQTCTLSWAVNGATSLSLDQGIGAVSGTSLTVRPAATTTYALTATNPAGSVTALTTVTVLPAPPVIVSFTASPLTITSGQACTLSWQVTGATGLSLSPGIGSVSGTSLAVHPNTTTVYTLTASNSAGSVAATVSVSVSGSPPGISVFTASPSSITTGQSSTLSWTVSGATSLSINQGIGTVSGSSRTVAPLATTTYVLVASNAAGSVSASVTVAVTLPKPSIASFSATPTALTSGQSTTLAWAVAYASSLTISPGPGTVTGSSIQVGPTSTTTYTLTATNSSGNTTATVMVTVTPPKPVIASFTATPASIASGQSSALAWSVTGATSLSIDQGVGAVSGSGATVSPTNSTTYTLTASNAGGSSTAAVTVTVTGSGPVIASFTASPSTAAMGQSCTLSWSVSGATRLSLDQGIGPVTGNSVVVVPTAEVTYTLSAANAYGTTTAPVTIHWTRGIFTNPGWPALGNSLLLPDGRLLQTDGTSVKAFDRAAGGFTLISPLNVYRPGCTMTLLPTGLVLVAGGKDGTPLVSAELFDPATGTCTLTGSMAVGRPGHTATLLGNGEVLFAGGAGSHASAELYDPRSGGFHSAGAMTVSREGGHTATRLANGMVLFTGGWTNDDGFVPLATAELYNPVTGVFTPTGPMAVRRYTHTATLLPSGLVLIVAGGISDLASVSTSSAELYDPIAGCFAQTGSMSTSRSSHYSTLLRNGRVLVAGGWPAGKPTHELATAELYDPAQGTFALTASMLDYCDGAGTLLPDGTVLLDGIGRSQLFDPQDPAPGTFTRKGMGSVAGMAVVLGNGLVLISPTELFNPATGATNRIAGPGNGAAGPSVRLPDGRVLITGNNSTNAALLSPYTNTYASAGPMVAARTGHTVTLLPNGRVLVAGGESNGSAFSHAEQFDPLTGSFAQVGSMITARSHHSATLLPNGRVLLAGGTGSGGALASWELYDPATGSFTATGPLTVARPHATAILLPTGRVLITGSWVNDPGGNVPAELYDPATGTSTATGLMDPGRQDHTATLLPNGKVLLAGGAWNGTSATASALIYDPDTGAFHATGSMSDGHAGGWAALLPNGMILIVGGGATWDMELYQ